MRKVFSQLIAFVLFFFFLISHLLGAWLRRRNLAVNNIYHLLILLLNETRTGYVIMDQGHAVLGTLDLFSTLPPRSLTRFRSSRTVAPSALAYFY
jgi:hypothetical protein